MVFGLTGPKPWVALAWDVGPRDGKFSRLLMSEESLREVYPVLYTVMSQTSGRTSFRLPTRWRVIAAFDSEKATSDRSILCSKT